MTRTKKKTKPSEKPPLQYITEDYCPRVLVFRRLNDIYEEHPKPEPGQYVSIYKSGLGSDEEYCFGLYNGADAVNTGDRGWLFERVNIDDAPEE